MENVNLEDAELILEPYMKKFIELLISYLLDDYTISIKLVPTPGDGLCGATSIMRAEHLDWGRNRINSESSLKIEDSGITERHQLADVLKQFKITNGVLPIDKVIEFKKHKETTVCNSIFTENLLSFYKDTYNIISIEFVIKERHDSLETPSSNTISFENTIEYYPIDVDKPVIFIVKYNRYTLPLLKEEHHMLGGSPHWNLLNIIFNNGTQERIIDKGLSEMLSNRLSTLQRIPDVVLSSENEKKKYTTIGWDLNAEPNLITVLELEKIKKEKIKKENLLRNILTTYASNINTIIDSYNS